MEGIPAGAPGCAGTGRFPTGDCVASKTMMPPVLIIEKQGEIIRMQSRLISDLYNELAQHVAAEELEERQAEIEKIKTEAEKWTF